MAKFKIGDRVKSITKLGEYPSGSIFIIDQNDSEIPWVICPDGSRNYWNEHYYVLTENKISQTLNTVSNTINKINTTFMSLVSKFKSIIRSEPEATFVKAGVMDESLNLTTEGTELFMQYMFSKHAAEFKTEVVDKLIEEK